MNQDHLSAAEVAMFREESFSSRSIEIGRHLMACKACRAKLPSVTPQEFRDCVLAADVPGLDKSDHNHRFFDFPMLSFARATAFAGLAILLIAGIYFVGIQRFNTSETTVAKNENNAAGSELNPVPDTVTNPTNDEKERLPVKTADVPNNDPGKKPSSTRAARRKVLGVAARERKVQNAETRGSENPCSGGATINLESNSDGKEVFLKWNAVKGAVSYDIYISDLDENLIDHFESKSQTEYRTIVQFDPDKAYQWKLIITLLNGKRIVGPSQVLKSVTDTEEPLNSKKAGRQRGTITIRCSETK